MATDPTPASNPSIYLQDIDEVRKVFQRFDTNSDGKISAAELEGVLNALGSVTSAAEVAKIMPEIDTDNDGYINLEEFAAFCNGDSDPYKSAEKELQEAFQLYDQDHNGKISAVELQKVLTRLGEHCSVDDCAGMIKSVDSNGDGYVSLEEFRKMMTTKSGNSN